MPLEGTPHSAQCHLGLSYARALPWGLFHPSGWEGSLGWAIWDSRVWLPKDHSWNGTPTHLLVLI